MSNSHDFPDEALEDFLGRHASARPGDELRHSLRERTTRIIRVRRRARRAGVLAALAACYAAGAVTVWLASPVGGTHRVSIVQSEPKEKPSEPAPTTAAAPRENDAELTPAALERLAETAGETERPRLFLTAGRRYESAGDMASAVRCYALYLDVGEPKDLTISAEDDSFLLMAMKADRRKERFDAPVDERVNE